MEEIGGWGTARWSDVDAQTPIPCKDPELAVSWARSGPVSETGFTPDRTPVRL